MSDYTQVFDYSAKDDLSSGNPNKKILGAEIDQEFSAISTAIASKLDTISDLTTVAIPDTASTDSVAFDDGGTDKRMRIQDMGVRVVELATIQTFALGDATTFQVLTGSTDRTWTIPTNASVAFNIGATILLGARDTAEITLDPASGPTLTSYLTSSTSTTQKVVAGGMAVLIKVATDEWMLSGDIAL